MGATSVPPQAFPPWTIWSSPQPDRLARLGDWKRLSQRALHVSLQNSMEMTCEISEIAKSHNFVSHLFPPLLAPAGGL